MSHYRKLTVDGVDYRYVIGNAFTFIQKMDLDRGKYVKHIAVDNEKLGQPYHDNFIVGPGNVARFLKGENPVKTYHCERHDFSTTHLTTDPFDFEIYNKVTLVPECPECNHESWMDT